MDTSIPKNKIYCFGEILWDILPDGPQPGGAPMNVAYHLTKLNLNAGLISRIGTDAEGKKLEQLLAQWDINSTFLQTDPAHDTSKVLARMDIKNEVKYEIVYPVAWDFIEITDEMIAAIKSVPYFVYGSLAARNTVSRKTLLGLLENAHYKVFDINLRSPFFEKDTLNTLLAKADLLKTNREELQILWEIFGNDLATEADQVDFIKTKFNIKEIIVTHGATGAVYYAQNNILHCKGVPVKVCDTIGSGDAFLAAFISGHFHKEKPEIILKKAVAMGSFIATKKGGCPSYELSEYLDFFHKISSI